MRKKILLLTLTLSAVMLAAGCGKPKTVKEDIVAESEEKDTVDEKYVGVGASKMIKKTRCIIQPDR